jgi:hypothetical protein
MTTMTDFATLTDALLRRAFPAGLSQAEYLATLRALAPHMSQRNLADVMSAFVRRDYSIVINDVLGIYDAHLDADVLARVESALERAGLAQWLREA